MGRVTLYIIYGQMLLKHSFESNATKSVLLYHPAGLYLVVGGAVNEKTIKTNRIS
jgi:hypothetical protein